MSIGARCEINFVLTGDWIATIHAGAVFSSMYTLFLIEKKGRLMD